MTTFQMNKLSLLCALVLSIAFVASYPMNLSESKETLTATNQTETGKQLNLLPVELKLKVLEFLSAKEASSLAESSKEYRRLFKYSSLFQDDKLRTLLVARQGTVDKLPLTNLSIPDDEILSRLKSRNVNQMSDILEYMKNASVTIDQNDTCLICEAFQDQELLTKYATELETHPEWKERFQVLVFTLFVDNSAVFSSFLENESLKIALHFTNVIGATFIENHEIVRMVLEKGDVTFYTLTKIVEGFLPNDPTLWNLLMTWNRELHFLKNAILREKSFQSFMNFLKVIPMAVAGYLFEVNDVKNLVRNASPAVSLEELNQLRYYFVTSYLEELRNDYFVRNGLDNDADDYLLRNAFDNDANVF